MAEGCPLCNAPLPEAVRQAATKTNGPAAGDFGGCFDCGSLYCFTGADGQTRRANAHEFWDALQCGFIEMIALQRLAKAEMARRLN